ncbi:MAG: cysteine desulfurase [Spirochaetaceae bacterium]|jgi:cysteine desulfurase|nr:cysteine desulfurase [Spirochaetaceae bacterium]
MKCRYYFDWAATAVPDVFPSKDFPFGNPSSRHQEGREARAALEDARRRCAAVLGAAPEEIFFTSGGTESNAIVLHSLLLRRNRPGVGGLLVSSVEHPSVRENAAVLERLGKPLTPIGVERDGRVSEKTLEAALKKAEDPRFAAIMAVNNETGAVMDMPRLAAVLRKPSGPPLHFHSDLVQAAGKTPVDLRAWDVDSASVSAHKLGGPRGIGLLYLRKPLEALCAGGGQEGRIRPGTENTAGALALAECLERRARRETVVAGYGQAAARWKVLITGLKALPRCTLIPPDREAEDRRFSPYILQAAFRGVPGEVMVRSLDDAGFAVSTGSACSSGGRDRPVLAAMGVDAAAAFEGIRISQGWQTSMEDIAALLEEIPKILRTL